MLVSLLLFAADPASAKYDRCLNSGDAANGIQSAMQRCADEEYRRQDVLLNQTYKAKMATLPAPKQAILRSLQRQWISVRDLRCRLKNEGSMARFDAVDCMATETAARTRWLQRYR